MKKQLSNWDNVLVLLMLLIAPRFFVSLALVEFVWGIVEDGTEGEEEVK